MPLFLRVHWEHLIAMADRCDDLPALLQILAQGGMALSYIDSLREGGRFDAWYGPPPARHRSAFRMQYG